jgi:hypothetical protein
VPTAGPFKCDGRPTSLSNNGHAKGRAMPRFRRSLVLPAAILAAGCLAAGCGSTVKNAVGSLPKPSVSLPARPSAGPSPGPSASPLPSPAVTTPSAAQPAPAPSVATSGPAAQPTSSPAPATTSGDSLLWLWILLGAVILIGAIVWIVRSRGRRSAVAAGWQSRVIDAYAKGSALHDAMSAAETPGALAAADAGARWSDIQRRGDDLGQALYALREAAPDEESRARVADALASLQAVRSAMDAERAPTGADPQLAAVVRGRLASFEASLRALRAPDQRAP